MKRTLYAVTVLCSVVASTYASSEDMPDAGQIAREIDMNGARKTVMSLDSKGQFEAVLTRIASGDPAWVSLARSLAQGTDASDSTGLIIALATALPKNPVAVLRTLDDGPPLTASAVCGAPFIEPAEGDVKAYLAQATPAVAGVDAAADLSQRTLCLSSLARVKARIEVNL